MANKKKKKIRVVELFAGVGGFRLGLEGWDGMSPSSGYSAKFESPFEVVWSNQWEPSTKVQHASDVYAERFGSSDHLSVDISSVSPYLPKGFDMLVGGFPCQDYSVARTLNQAQGLVGKKGVLWWEIHRLISERSDIRPSVLFLENVDRLLKSPAKQRGRDFAIMLASLSDLGYLVEWRVINAADYGMPQRRRRIFIVAYLKDSPIGVDALNTSSPIDWILDSGIFAAAFPVVSLKNPPVLPFPICGELDEISENFPASIVGTDLESNPEVGRKSPFENSGIMINRQVFTLRTEPVKEVPVVLDDIVFKNGKVTIPDQYYLTPETLDTWKYLKGAKKDNWRTSKSGFKYNYNEGPLPFPDPLDRPARTIITGEGGSTPSRFKHVVEIVDGKPRRLIPEELEKLNMFPPGHTSKEGISDVKRAFFMGNALVVGVVERVGIELARRLLP